MRKNSKPSTQERRREFTELLEPLRERLYRFARHLSWDRSGGEDLLQDAVMTAWRKFGDYKRGTNFRAWIFQITANIAANRNRSFARRNKRQVAVETLDYAPDARSRWADLSVLDGQEAVLDNVADWLAAALRELPAVRRAAFLLRVVEGFRYREIAEFLDIPIGTVMSHLARARKALQETLEPEALAA